MKKKWYKIAISIIAIILAIIFGFMLARECNEFNWVDFYYLNNINSKAHDVILDEFNIYPFEGIFLKRAGLSGGRDTSLYAEIIIDESLLSKFKKKLLFKSPKIDLRYCDPLIIMGNFATISKNMVDCIEKNDKGGIKIVYLKEKDGKVKIFLSKDEREKTISSEVQALFIKK